MEPMTTMLRPEIPTTIVECECAHCRQFADRKGILVPPSGTRQARPSPTTLETAEFQRSSPPEPHDQLLIGRSAALGRSALQAVADHLSGPDDNDYSARAENDKPPNFSRERRSCVDQQGARGRR